MNEEWRDVPGYEGSYIVSNLGNIRRCSNRALGSNGKYPQVQIQMNGQKKAFNVHSLVARAFLGEPPFDKAQVNHINGDPRDNRLENLEWVSPSQNLQHSYDIGLRRGPAKYIVRCHEHGITTHGTVQMVTELKKIGYLNVSTGGILLAVQRNGTHHGLTFGVVAVPRDYRPGDSPADVYDQGVVPTETVRVDVDGPRKRARKSNKEGSQRDEGVRTRTEGDA